MIITRPHSHRLDIASRVPGANNGGEHETSIPRRCGAKGTPTCRSAGEQTRTIMRRHPWLPPLLTTRPVLGPNGLVLLEHVLEALAPHPASSAAKLEAFGLLNAATPLF